MGSSYGFDALLDAFLVGFYAEKRVLDPLHLVEFSNDGPHFGYLFFQSFDIAREFSGLLLIGFVFFFYRLGA